MSDYEERVDALEVLLGHRAAELVVQNGRVVDVWTGDVREGGVAVDRIDDRGGRRRGGVTSARARR